MSSPLGTVPAGIDLNATHTLSTIISVAVLVFLGVGSVILRIVARRYTPMVDGLAIDDYFLVVALIFAIGNGACCIATLPFGGGKHIWALSQTDIATIFQITWAYSEVYATCVTLTKISILLFYERIFTRNWATQTCMALTVMFWIVNTVVFLVGCRPISYFWDRYAYPDTSGAAGNGQCIYTQEYNLWIGVSDVIIDILVLLIPIQNIYKLNISLKQKAGVCGIFMLGIFAPVAGAQRAFIMRYSLSNYDLAWNLACAYIWTCVEPMVGIICACLPTYAILFRRLKSAHGGGNLRNWKHIDTEGRAENAQNVREGAGAGTLGYGGISMWVMGAQQAPGSQTDLHSKPPIDVGPVPYLTVRIDSR